MREAIQFLRSAITVKITQRSKQHFDKVLYIKQTNKGKEP